MSIRSILVVCAAAAFVAGSTLDAATAAPTTLRLIAVSSTQSGGARPGDTVIFTELLYRPGASKPLGHDEGACIVQSASAWNCSVTFYLPDGKILVSGAFHFVKQPRVPIVGGTGAYAGRSGWFEFTGVSQTRFVDTFHFTK